MRFEDVFNCDDVLVDPHFEIKRVGGLFSVNLATGRDSKHEEPCLICKKVLHESATKVEFVNNGVERIAVGYVCPEHIDENNQFLSKISINSRFLPLRKKVVAIRHLDYTTIPVRKKEELDEDDSLP